MKIKHMNEKQLELLKNINCAVVCCRECILAERSLGYTRCAAIHTKKLPELNVSIAALRKAPEGLRKREKAIYETN